MVVMSIYGSCVNLWTLWQPMAVVSNYDGCVNLLRLCQRLPHETTYVANTLMDY